MSLVKPRHLNLYKRYTLQLIKDLGKQITVVLVGVKSNCSNCKYDKVTDSSNGVYNGTGPKPFKNGSVCPVCGGKGKITTSESKTITAICRWVNPTTKEERFEQREYGLDPQGYLRVKAPVDYYNDFKTAEHFMFDGERYRLINVIKRGMKETVVTVAFLERENV